MRDLPRPSSLVKALLLSGLLGLGGCALDVPHLGRAVSGHLGVLQATRPVQDWLADPDTPAALRERLQLARDIRAFAVRELQLPDNASYTRYADIGRSAVLWNVVAAPELSFELKRWCYPVTGCVGYRGHFELQRAEREAQALRAQGLEVYLYGVPAYSTLGWTNWLGGDPLLNTFAAGSPIELARLVFHELAHQVVYAGSDMTFSESFATAVERIGLERWALHPSSAVVPAAEWSRWHRRQQQRRELGERVGVLRGQLTALYASRLVDEVRRERKADLMQRFRADYEALRDGPWAGDRAFDAWVASLNNAGLALQGSYEQDVPAFLALFEREGRDFNRFYAAVRALAGQDEPQRRRQITELGAPARSPS